MPHRSPAGPRSFGTGAQFSLRHHHRTLLAEGEVARTDLSADGGVAEALRSGHLGPHTVVGVIPFDRAAPSRLIAARRLWTETTAMVRPAPAHRYRIEAVVEDPSPAHYEAAVETALDRIGRGPLVKVVLARRTTVRADRPLDLDRIVEAFGAADPGAYVFAVHGSLGGDEAIDRPHLVGASPELIVRRRGARVETNPLAGSRPRGADAEEDRHLAATLADSAKDRHEHRLVVDQIRDALSPLCDEIVVPDTPSVIATSTMWHLSSTIRGRLSAPRPGALDVALALHPTPAVCGTPTGDARATIAELEGFDRGPYSGLVGWQEPSGDGEWVLVLRCAEVRGDSATIFAGAGVVAGSDPRAELAETRAKAGTVWRALGLDDAPESRSSPAPAGLLA